MPAAPSDTLRHVRRRQHRGTAATKAPCGRRLGLALFNAVDGATDLFACPVCRGVLDGPVTADCGHTFCKRCLLERRCAVCDGDVGAEDKRAVNVLVQEVVDKWREVHASNGKDPGIPETADILGIEPRYCLRSGNAGIQTRKCCIENNVSKIIKRLVLPQKRRAKSKEDAWHQCKKKRRTSDDKNNWLERYSDDVPSKDVVSVLRNVNAIREKARFESWKHVAPSDLECILCSRCLFDPITTRCGHTFCRGCLARVIDHGLACPLCMGPLSPYDEARGTTQVLDRALKFLAPNEYKQRLVANRHEIKILEKDSKVPVFVCTNAFPGVACPLYVYEPRYRLLARRCLQSRTRRFAMAARTDTAEKFASFGTILEVRDAVHLHDGTSILTTIGVRRFRVIDKGEQDGYDTATVQYMKDNAVSVEKLPELLNLHQRVYNKAAKWVQSLTPRVLAEVENCIGKMPPLEDDWYSLPDGPSWAWWLMPILPLSPKLQIGFLYTTDLEKRLRAIDKMLEHMKVKMRALKRNTLKCADTVDNDDSCRLAWIF